jgi:hypothetical protein
VARPARKEWLLLGVGIGLALFALEAGVRTSRLLDPRPTGYAPVDTDARGPRPRNAQGYRDVEHALAKPPGTRRLVALGDSFAWGASVHFEDAYPQRLGRGLTRRRQEPWEVIALALPGLATPDHAAQLEAEGMAFDPDVVVLGYVLNDAESREQVHRREAAYAAREERAPSLLDRSALVRFVKSRLEASAEARERIAYHRSLYDERTGGWPGARAALQRMGRLCRERGIPFVVAIFPLLGNPLDASYPFADIHRQVAAAAAESGAKVVDLLDNYRGLRWELLVVNGARDEHPNEIAHRIAADAILRAFDGALPPRAALRAPAASRQ